MYGIRSHHFKYFLNSLILMESILTGNISHLERYKCKLLNKNTQQYLICLIECSMKIRNVEHKCINYFIKSMKNHITKKSWSFLINRRYMLRNINEFEKKLLAIIFDNNKSFGPGPFIEYYWKKYRNNFRYRYSSIQYFKSKTIKLNIHPTYLKNNGYQSQTVYLSENDPIFKFKFGVAEEDEILHVELSIVKMNTIFRNLQMKNIMGECYISIPKSQIYPVQLHFRGGINKCISFASICPSSYIKERMSDMIVDIVSIFFCDGKITSSNIFQVVSQCSLNKRNCINRISDAFGFNIFVICSKLKNYKCFMDGCVSNYFIMCINDNCKDLNICNFCNGSVLLKDKLFNFFYKCSSDHICCRSCFVHISKLIELGFKKMI